MFARHDTTAISGTNHARPWDAIVVGSGLGGLTTAAYLATNGLRTLVLEQDDTAGGCSQVFRRKRQWEFDVGLHYIGDCLPGGAIPTVLRGVGLEGKIEFLAMDPDGFDTLVFPDLTIRVPAGWGRYLERLIEAFPDEERGLRKCIGVLEKIGMETDRIALPQSLREFAVMPFKAPGLVRWGLRPLAALYDACDLSERARAVISAQSGDYASPPSRVPIALHAGLIHHYLKDGAFYPKGGGQVIAAHLVDVIRTHGGAVRTRARVEKIVVDGGKVTGVTLRGGETFESSRVISNADVKRTYLDLVGREHISAKTAKRVEGYRMSAPLFCVYLGIDIDLNDRMPNTNLWYSPEYDAEGAYTAWSRPGAIDRPLPVYVSSASLKDPGNPHSAPPGNSSLEVMTMVPPDYDFWGVTDGPAAGERYGRNPEYLARKEQVTESMLESAEKLIPGLRDHIVWQESSSPITHERYTLATGGTSYGIELAVDQFGQHRPRPKTEISGLYLAGASTVFCHGIFGAMTGGVGTASAVLGRDLRREIRSGRVFADTSKLTAGGPGWDPLMSCRRLSRKTGRARDEVAPVRVA